MEAVQKQVNTKSSSGKTAGRPRSEEARLAILGAAYELLYKAPAREITTSEIAARAGVSTATLYRWWRTKEAVLLDAYITKVNRAFPRSRGTGLAGLRENALRVGRVFQGKHARVTVRLLVAIQEDERLRKAFLERLCGPEMGRDFELIEQAIAQGELPAHTDRQLLLDSIIGVLLMRLLVGNAPINNEVIHSVFDFAVAGAAHAKTSQPESSARRDDSGC